MFLQAMLHPFEEVELLIRLYETKVFLKKGADIQ